MQIVIADQEHDHAAELARQLEAAGHSVAVTHTDREALNACAAGDVDLIIADTLTLPIDRIPRQQMGDAPPPVVVISTDADVFGAVKAMQRGALDFFPKPVDPALVFERLDRQPAKPATRRNGHPHKAAGAADFGLMIGRAPAMQRVFDMVQKVADTDSNVIIYGETGVGKELVARALHERSNRKEKPIIPVNCGAIPKELLESELFGHEKGAFTGAHRSRIGRFEMAHGGSIFLDEIGDMSPSLQVKILRVLQEREFERVGGVRPITVDVRIIAATHRDLEKAVEDGVFRDDLYYRLNVIPVHVPPLRERISDIELMVPHFIEIFNHEKRRKVTGITPDAMQCLRSYRWPGNVRELQNMVERLVILRGSGDIDISDLPPNLQTSAAATAAESPHLPAEGASFTTMVTSYEKEIIQQALSRTRGVKNKAAKLLQMKRTTLVEKMKKLDISYDDHDPPA